MFAQSIGMSHGIVIGLILTVDIYGMMAQKSQLFTSTGTFILYIF